MKRIRKDNQGMTMVEVLMGFVILTLMLGMLSHIISFSSNLYQQSIDIKRMEEYFEANIYKKDLTPKGAGLAVSVKEVHEEPNGSTTITEAKYKEGAVEKSITLKQKVYTMSSTEFPPVIGVDEDPEIVITFFK